MNNDDFVPGSGLFTEYEMLALATAIGTARNGEPFTTDEVCELIKAAADAMVAWELWKGVIDGTFVVDIVDGEFVFNNSPETKKLLKGDKDEGAS